MPRSVIISELTGPKDRLFRHFLDLPGKLMQGDPAYVRPLDMEVRDRLSPKNNPFFQHGEAAMWLAFDNGVPVGRMTTSIDRAHLERYNDGAGFFGFLDTTNDPAAASALLEHGATWLRKRGMKRMRGPLSLNINEETGTLVEGFDTPAMLMMPHHARYQGTLIEQAGFSKLKDLYAWRYSVGEVPLRARKAHDDVVAMSEVTARQANTKDFLADVRLIMDVFNDAWSDNWGFVPITEAELIKMAKDLQMIVAPELTRLVFINGEIAAVSLALPNLNEAVRDFGGKLSPVTVAKLLWRTKVKRPKTARLMILGVRKKFRNMRKYMGLSPYMFVEMNDSAANLGITMGELSWTLEDNAAINVAIKLMGGRVYKKYRIYERELST